LNYDYVKPQKQRKSHQIMRHEKPLSGVKSYLEGALGLNIKLGLVSSSSKE
jgi:beta-phosphoglucomutase-like phosphatase (HAD superfamily)